MQKHETIARTQEKAVVVLCTCPSNELANVIAKALIKKKLAACVNILPKMQSVYCWEGEITIDDEYQLVIKSHEALFSEIEMLIKNLHEYEVPELIAVPIVNGSNEYLDWLNQSVKKVVN